LQPTPFLQPIGHSCDIIKHTARKLYWSHAKGNLRLVSASVGWPESKKLLGIFYICLVVLVPRVTAETTSASARSQLRRLTSSIIPHESPIRLMESKSEASFGWSNFRQLLGISHIYLIVFVSRITADTISASCRPQLRRLTSSNIPHESPNGRMQWNFEASFGCFGPIKPKVHVSGILYIYRSGQSGFLRLNEYSTASITGVAFITFLQQI
jgi:hypothetical protein